MGDFALDITLKSLEKHSAKRHASDPVREAAQRIRAHTERGVPLYPDEAREIAELLDPTKGEH